VPYQFPNPYPCPFCEFFSGRLPFEPIVETLHAIAFVNTVDRGSGGIIVAPRRHVETISRLSGAEAAGVMAVLRENFRAVVARSRPDGCHTWCSAGMLAGQSVAHMHFQVQVRVRGVPYSYASSTALAPVPISQRKRYAAELRSARGSSNSGQPAPLVPFECPAATLAPYPRGALNWQEAGAAIWETEHHLAVVPERMRAPGALVIVPKREVGTFLDLTEAEAEDLIRCVRESARRIEQIHRPDGLNTWWETGSVADQRFRHMLTELVPRHAGNPYRYTDMNDVPIASSADRFVQAQRLREPSSPEDSFPA
jgi:histidine triad (HIT) family protein